MKQHTPHTTSQSEHKTTHHKSYGQWKGTGNLGRAKIITCLIWQRLEESAYYILIIFGTRVSQDLKARISASRAVNKFVKYANWSRGGCRFARTRRINRTAGVFFFFCFLFRLHNFFILFLDSFGLLLSIMRYLYPPLFLFIILSIVFRCLLFLHFAKCRWEILVTNKKKGAKIHWAQMAMMASRWSY